MFTNFKSDRVELEGVVINYKTGGQGPPLLLLHGYPQTHTIWHKIALGLSKQFTVVVSDLRGYGDSAKPPTTSNHEPYSKRSMSKDQILLMRHLGHEHFMVAGHDRGGRVGHRMALDYPDVVGKLAVLDIAPTYVMYKTADMEFATAYYHWFFLIQPFDLPESMIGQNARYFFEKKFRQWGWDNDAFTPTALKEYLRCLTPEMIHASCEDYRASASIDLEHDQTDIDRGHKIQCPVLCLWGEKGFVGNKYDVPAEWRKWADHVTGYGLPCGHYLPEESPDETLNALLQFFQTK